MASTTGGDTGTFLSDAGGTSALDIGGTLNVADGQAAGTYTGTVGLDITYQ